jgi:hypothetical protein
MVEAHPKHGAAELQEPPTPTPIEMVKEHKFLEVMTINVLQYMEY